MATHKSTARVMVLGLDGATWDLLGPWLEAGYLPNLAALRASAAWGRLRSTTPPFSATAWTTFATGVNPGRHGIFDFWIRRGNERQPISSLAVGAPTLWDLVSQAGQRVAVINLPVTYPPRPVNGVMVSGMMTPGEKATYTYPPELKEQLRAVAGGYRADPYAAITQSRAFLRQAREWVCRRERAHRWLLLREPWDLFINVIQAPDPIQHYFWTFLLPGHPDYDTREGEVLRGLALDVFREVDTIVGQRLRLLGPWDTLLVMSDHGAGEATHWFNLNRWLAEAGFLALSGRGRPGVLAGRLDGGRLFDLLRRLDILHLRQRVGNLARQRLRERVDRLMASDVDWTRTVAYAGSPSAEAIYLHTAGGRLQGAAYERVRDEIAEGLLALAGPDGGPVVEAVYRREELYHGPYLDQAPDLILEIGHRPYILSEALSTRELFTRIPYRAARGRHRPEGILMIYGPYVRQPGERPPARIEDLAPTILALLGLPVPAEMDGRVLSEWLGEVPVETGLPQAPTLPTPALPPYSEEEAAAIARRLRALGYLD